MCMELSQIVRTAWKPRLLLSYQIAFKSQTAWQGRHSRKSSKRYASYSKIKLIRGLCCGSFSSRNVCAGNAQPTRRYKGPYVSELSIQSLSQAPKPWPAFFMGEKSASSRATYTLPADTTMLLDRIEENLVFFLVRLFSPGNRQQA